ncbi:pollen Ole e 1 allergen and extensin family protein [Striga asiatica]|uniref:Pollen Ole e 1 allergen and extensin family protein n=1 Tax=Striga asiatica TaxID=4170 RepID=A0A5A7PUU6_STRAF|nr:pollen Ole e 1 allergen and extensin family protein [Striga asiatica]
MASAKALLLSHLSLILLLLLLHWAKVRLQCNNTKSGMTEQATTDKNGYFCFLPKRVTTAAFHKCKVFLVSSPVSNCSVPTNFHGGFAGALLIPSRTPPPKPAPHLQFFNVGPLAFDAPKNLTCHY